MTFRKTIILCTWVLMAAGSAQAGFITPGLEKQLSTMQDNDVAKVLVVMNQQADIRQLDWDLHDSKAPLALRHRTVMETLRNQSKESQKDLLNDLIAYKADNSIRGFTPHWIVNSVVVTGTVARIRQLASRVDVEQVEANLVVELIKPVPPTNTEKASKNTKSIGIAPNIVAIGARRVWNELGINGEGVIVGILDTGVSDTHPALQPRWRGNFAPAAECWLDAANLGQPTPQDTHGHGTHVMGILTGLAPNDTIGVAPGAYWIATNIINADDVGLEFDNGVLASLEFMTDPDGDPLTIDDVPAVVQNSWGINEAWDGYFECDSRWWDAIDNCEAAGVVLTWSAGNEGPGAGSMRSPADRAASPTNCFSVGSTRHFEPFNISYSSSRGPSGCGGQYSMKPEIVAPGSFIYSANAYNDGYIESSGTSMAGPHVAGVVALMRASNPNLDPITIKEALMNTAVDLGDPGPDNVYGHGLLNAYAAVLAVMDGVGTIEGYITDAGSGLPIENSLVQKIGSPYQVYTDEDGFFSMTTASGESNFQVSNFGFFTGIINVTIPEEGSVDGSLVLVPQINHTISGFVYGPEGAIVPQATVLALGIPVQEAIADLTGFYSLNLPSGLGNYYDLRSRAQGLGSQVQEIELVANLTLDFNLPELFAEDFESADFLSFPWDQGSNPWVTSNNSPYEGIYCGHSGTTETNQSTQLSITLNCLETSPLDFWYKVSSEANYDFLRFYIDGIQQGEWGGEVPWAQFSMAIEPGEHTFLWSYEKDSSVSIGDDAGYIDYIEFPEHLPAEIPVIELDSSFFESTLVQDATEEQNLRISNNGIAPLTFTINLDDGSKGRTQSPLVSIPDWVSVSPNIGSIASGANQSISVNFSAVGLASGAFNAVMTIASDDPVNSSIELPVALFVEDGISPAGEAMPEVVTLTGAVPNPFNPQTQIKFGLPDNLQVQLNVYDVSGNLIRSLLNEEMIAGHHTVSWFGKDDFGQSAASGTYFIRLVAGLETSVKSMVLIR